VGSRGRGNILRGLADRRGGRAVAWLLVGLLVLVPVAFLVWIVVHH
jgi:hypothetical protein